MIQNKLFSRLNAFILGVVIAFSLISNLQFSLPVQAQSLPPVPSEPACQTSTATPTWNGYTPLVTNLDSPDIVSGSCKDMPMIGFDPIDKSQNNPRSITVTQGQNLNLRVYYNNSARPGSAAIQNPNVRLQLIKVSPTQYRVTGVLSGANAATLNSANAGGDLTINVPPNTKFDIVGQNTLHYPDAIERKYVAETNTADRPAPYNAAPWDNFVTVYDRIPDNGTVVNTSNPIWSAFDGKTLASSNGFTIKSGGLEAGYLGYGYILTSISAQAEAPTILPPQITGQEITIVRGQSGSFNPLAPTDQNNPQLLPIALTSTNFPSFCANAAQMAAGYTITCQTDANTPVRTVFNITPTNSAGVVGTPGTWIVNVIEPRIDAVKECFVRGTNTPCSSTTLRAGDQVTYRVTVSSTGTSPALNVTLTDTYDRVRLTNITSISDSGVHDATAGTILWTLGNMNQGTSRSVTFDATVASTVQNGDIIINTVVARSTGLPDITRQVQFPVTTGVLQAIKECFVKGTNTPCSTTVMKAGDQVTYKITVTNPSSSTVNNVRIVDTYDRVKLSTISNISDSGTQDAAAGTISWNLGNLNASASKFVTFDATIASTVVNGDIIINTAVIRADGQPDITVRVQFPIGDGIPVLSTSSKTCVRKGTSTNCAGANLKPGDSVTYTIVVRNTGTGPALNVRVIDTYDKVRLNNITNLNPNGTIDVTAGTINWSLGNINAGASVTLTFDATLTSSALNGDTVINNAVIKSDNLPDQNVSARFPISILTVTTARSGGFEVVTILLGLGLVGFGAYYYTKNPKWAANFIPKRSTEVGKKK